VRQDVIAATLPPARTPIDFRHLLHLVEAAGMIRLETINPGTTKPRNNPSPEKRSSCQGRYHDQGGATVIGTGAATVTGAAPVHATAA
jgi:hypothetical protein